MRKMTNSHCFWKPPPQTKRFTFRDEGGGFSRVVLGLAGRRSRRVRLRDTNLISFSFVWSSSSSVAAASEVSSSSSLPVIVHVPEAQRSDGVTVASKSLSLSLSGYVVDGNSCLWLNARAFDAVCEPDLDCAFEGDLAEVFDVSLCSSIELLPCYFFWVLMSCCFRGCSSKPCALVAVVRSSSTLVVCLSEPLMRRMSSANLRLERFVLVSCSPSLITWSTFLLSWGISDSELTRACWVGLLLSSPLEMKVAVDVGAYCCSLLVVKLVNNCMHGSSTPCSREALHALLC